MAIFLNAPIPELKDVIVLGRYIAYGDSIAPIHTLGGGNRTYLARETYLEKGFEELHAKFDAEVKTYYHPYDDDFFMGEYIGDGDGEPYETPFNVDNSYEECSKSDNPILRTLVAENGKCLDVLLNDPDGRVRAAAVSNSSQEIKKSMINDSDWRVRQSIANYGGDELRALLVNDECDEVLIAIIVNAQAQDTIQFAKHKSVAVRCAVAGKLRDPDLVATGLMTDESDEVRASIINRGEGFDYLKDDPSPLVQKAIREYEIPW